MYLSGTCSSCADTTVTSSSAVVSPTARKDLKDTIVADGEGERREKSTGRRGWGREGRQVKERRGELAEEGSSWCADGARGSFIDHRG